MLIGQNKVCWNLQTLCWLRQDGLQNISCICVPFCLLAMVILALQAFSCFSVLCGQLLCFFRDHDDFLASKAAASPIIICKARCEKAEDYTKRKHVFRWCVWIVWLLAVCPSINSGYFHLLQHLMWAIDSHCYCVDCAMPQAVGHYPVPKEAWVGSQTRPCEIYCGKWHCDRSFSLYLVSPCLCCCASAPWSSLS